MKTQEKIVRWTKLRKAAILNQIDEHPTQANKIMALHNLSPEEIDEWRKALASHGVEGLRATRLQHYRKRTKLDISSYAHLNYYTPKTKAKAPIK